MNSTGSERSLKEMKREDLVQFYETYYRPNNATLIIVGDVKLKDIKGKLEPLLASWKPADLPKLSLPPAPTVASRKLFLIDKPGAPQSEVRIGYPAVARTTPDFFAIQLMNRVLGGQFASRLNMNLREKHGFTYGARSGFTFNKHPGPFVAAAGVTTAKTDSALREFFYEIDRTCTDGITAEELEFVKKGMTGNFALTFETPQQIAAAMQNLVLYSLPDSYYETYLQNIAKVTLEDVKRVARQYLDSSKMAVVIVGDLKVIREGLDKMSIGETVVLDVNGNKIQ
jgi:predicted Zn-dependent peptidase